MNNKKELIRTAPVSYTHLDVYKRQPAFDNTAAIAERCNVEIEFGHTQLPHFDAPGGDSLAYFREECYKGLHRHYGEQPDPALVDRLEYESDFY